MKKSLRLQLILLLFAGTAVVIVTYRMVAKYAVRNTIYLQTRIEMQEALNACLPSFDSRNDFLSCYKRVNQQSLTTAVADQLKLCYLANSSQPSTGQPQCTENLSTETVWLNHKEYNPAFEWFMPLYLRPQWLGARVLAGGKTPVLLLTAERAEKLTEQLWAVREVHFRYIMPLIVIMLVVLGSWCIRVLFKPLGKLAESLRSLTANNFTSTHLDANTYIEFEKITAIYQDMCRRLADSFDKERNFTAAASHELRTPLTILRGTSERLIAALPDAGHAQVLARTMGDEVERLIEISEKLLLLSRADAQALVLQREPFDLSQYVLDFATDARVFQQRISIGHDIAPDVVWYCDKVLIKQLVQNLYTNALKYNRPAGHIHFRLAKLANAFELQLTNTTADVTPDLESKAFDRFYRGDAARNRSVDGLGLGLSICLEIAKAHAAQLSFSVHADQRVGVRLEVPFA